MAMVRAASMSWSDDLPTIGTMRSCAIGPCSGALTCRDDWRRSWADSNGAARASTSGWTVRSRRARTDRPCPWVAAVAAWIRPRRVRASTHKEAMPLLARQLWGAHNRVTRAPGSDARPLPSPLRRRQQEHRTVRGARGPRRRRPPPGSDHQERRGGGGRVGRPPLRQRRTRNRRSGSSSSGGARCRCGGERPRQQR